MRHTIAQYLSNNLNARLTVKCFVICLGG